MSLFKQKTEKDLQELETLEQILKYMSDNYDLTEPLGRLTKPMVISGIMKAIAIVNAKPKT